MPTAEQSRIRSRNLLAKHPIREKSDAEKETDRRIQAWLDEAFPLRKSKQGGSEQ